MKKYIFGETSIDIPDQPGEVSLIEDLSIEDYHDLGNIAKHGDNAVLSKSQLADMDCPAKFKYKYIDGGAKKEKDFLNIGNAVHTLALEPDLFKERFYILPEGHRRDVRTAAHKAEVEVAAGRKMIPAKDYEDIKGMAAALAADEKSVALLKRPGKIEASIIWRDPDTGLLLRTRPDFLGDDDLIVDVKTGHSAEPQKFNKTAFDLHYDISAAMTVEGVTRLRGKRPDDYVFLVAESEPPYVIEAYDSFRPWDPTDITKFTYFDAGSFRLRRALHRFIECKKSGIWPGYNRLITPMAVPGYAMKKLEGEKN